MKKLKLLLLIIMSAFVIVSTQNFDVDATLTEEPLVIDGNYVYHYGTSDRVMIPTTYTQKDTEFRGSWVATVWNLDFPKHTSETQYKAAFQDLIDDMLANKMNAMVFQIRSMNDAFYDSDYAPWSKWLTGTEGTDPGWNVLEWMISECHANGIEFHAWLNPYRVANASQPQSTYLNTLHNDNWAKQNPGYIITGDTYQSGGNTIYPIILNPGEPAVKQYIRDVINEIITNYDVDGIHFDDYFYPSSGTNSDTATYNAYNPDGLNIHDWRRENVNEVIENIKLDIDAHNESTGKTVRFGISPSGVWASDQQIAGGSNTSPVAHDSYFTQYADTKKWVEQGWLHYIAPQIYRDFEHTLIPYADIVDWWASVCRGTGVDLIIGHSLYMTHFDDEEVSRQIVYNQKHPEIKGSLMYSQKWTIYNRYQYLVDNYWTTIPSNVWETSDVEGPDVTLSGTQYENVYISDVTVTLTAADDIYYRFNTTSDWMLYSTPLLLNTAGAHTLYMKTVNTEGEESIITSQNVVIQYRNPDVPEISVTGTKIGDNYVLGSTVTITSDSEDIYVAINHGSVGEWTLYTGPITLDDTGGYTIKAKTIDDRGTDSNEVSTTFTVQEECYPNPTLELNGTGTYPYFQNVTLTVTGTAPSFLYKINDDSFITYNSPFVLDTEGTYTITIKNDDACGTEVVDTIYIDQTPPSAPTLTITGDYDGEKYYTSNTTLTFNTTDTDATIMYRLHNGKSWTEWTEYVSPLELLFTANYTLEYEAFDPAGNSSGEFEESVRLKIPPSEHNEYVVRNGEIVTYYNSTTPVTLPTEYTEKTEEIRAVWIATVANIDIKQYTTESDYKATIINMLNTLEVNNFNTIFFQVRPMNDAWYDSSYAPWSRYLTGVEGGDPGWDVFGFIVEEAHKRGIEVHAWLNPYRVSSSTGTIEEQLNALHDDNFAKQNPDMIIQDNAGKLILNPGKRQVQVYIRNVIQELINKYDIDGVHFDDYFYSYNGTPEDADESLYIAKREPGQSKDDWRRENINTVVREVFELIEQYNQENSKTIEFGISPFGIWKSGEPDGSNTSPYTLSSYEDQYADSKRWVEEGWVHYILPQLYWEFSHNSAPFADLTDWWAALCEENDVDLIIGHGFYRYVDNSWGDVNELPEQLRYMSQYDSIIGSSFFSYKTLLSSDTEVVQVLERLNNYYWTEYATFPWESTVEKEPDPTCEDGYELVDGECVLIPPVCEDGTELVDGECLQVCSDEQHRVDGECVDRCEDGYEYINGECTMETDPTCEAGFEFDPDSNECVEKKTGCFSSIQSESIYIMIIAALGFMFYLFTRKRISHD